MKHAVLQATATGFDETFKVMVVMAIIGALMGLVLRRNRAAQAAQPAGMIAA
jgi:hypothetical protein